jgi:hypothetical protein
VIKRDAILNEQCIMRNGAIIGHISILIGQKISLKSPIF